MDSREFKGDLKTIKAARLIKSEETNDIENFFLVLGLVFNDLKGLMFFDQALEEYRPSQREINKQTPTVQIGNFAGISTQIYRLVASLISEFLVFLEDNKNILETTEFRMVFDELNIPSKVTWGGLVDVATNPEIVGTSNFKKNLIKIRGNITYHYYGAGKNLRKGFLDFFNKNKFSFNELAYYSLGSCMEESRFFYADAAAQEYIFSLVRGKNVDKNDNKKDLESFEEHKKEIRNIIDSINITLAMLLKKYLERRPYR